MMINGDLLAGKLRRLSSSSKLCAKHEIDNIIFKYMLQNEKINKQMSKLLQEINLQVLRQLHWHQFRQIVLYSINCINSRCINNWQYRQHNFQISTVLKHKKKAMWTKTQLLQACLITISYQTRSCLVTYLTLLCMGTGGIYPACRIFFNNFFFHSS